METNPTCGSPAGQAASEYAIVLTVVLVAVAGLFLLLSGAVPTAIEAVAGIL